MTIELPKLLNLLTTLVSFALTKVCSSINAKLPKWYLSFSKVAEIPFPLIVLVVI